MTFWACFYIIWRHKLSQTINTSVGFIWAVHGLKDDPFVGTPARIVKLHHGFPLWYTSKLWAADHFGNTPPQQLPCWFSVLLDELKVCGGDSVAWHPTAVPPLRVPRCTPTRCRPGRTLLRYRVALWLQGSKSNWFFSRAQFTKLHIWVFSSVRYREIR